MCLRKVLTVSHLLQSRTEETAASEHRFSTKSLKRTVHVCSHHNCCSPLEEMPELWWEDAMQEADELTFHFRCKIRSAKFIYSFFAIEIFTWFWLWDSFIVYGVNIPQPRRGQGDLYICYVRLTWFGFFQRGKRGPTASAFLLILTGGWKTQKKPKTIQSIPVNSNLVSTSPHLISQVFHATTMLNKAGSTPIATFLRSNSAKIWDN